MNEVEEKIKNSDKIYKDKYGNKIYSEISNRKVYYHVWIWENFMGVEVPFDGKFRCHIHHLDENIKNNDIRNLVCITKSEHQRHHRIHKKASIKTIERMSKSMMGFQKGKNRSEETKDKISKTKTIHREGDIWIRKNGTIYQKIDGKLVYRGII